jgi:hypothetical protein
MKPNPYLDMVNDVFNMTFGLPKIEPPEPIDPPTPIELESEDED